MKKKTITYQLTSARRWSVRFRFSIGLSNEGDNPIVVILITLLLKLAGFLVVISLWLFGVGLLVWYPLRWWPGDRLWPVRWLNYLMPWLLCLLLPGLVIAGATRRRYLLALLAIPTLLISFAFAPLFMPRAETVLADNQSFKVMSYNVWTLNRDPEAVVAVIRQEQPDILLLQELRTDFGAILFEKLKAVYPDETLYMAYESVSFQGVISRYPVKQVSVARARRVQRVLVRTPAGPVMVWNLHHHQPIDWSRHAHEMDVLVRQIKNFSGRALIVGGDFNTTDQSDGYARLSQQLANAHWEAGWGFGFSFPAYKSKVDRRLPIPGPMLRIDHLFYNDYLFAHAARTLPTSGDADHLPIVAEFSLVK